MNQFDYQDAQLLEDAVPVITAKTPGTLRRSEMFAEAGLFKICDHDCALYSLVIHTTGGWGSITTYNAKGEPKFYHPSSFTGSFHHRIWHEGGMFLRLNQPKDSPAVVTLTWEEKDAIA